MYGGGGGAQQSFFFGGGREQPQMGGGRRGVEQQQYGIRSDPGLIQTPGPYTFANERNMLGGGGGRMMSEQQQYGGGAQNMGYGNQMSGMQQRTSSLSSGYGQDMSLGGGGNLGGYDEMSGRQLAGGGSAESRISLRHLQQFAGGGSAQLPLEIGGGSAYEQQRGGDMMGMQNYERSNLPLQQQQQPQQQQFGGAASDSWTRRPTGRQTLLADNAPLADYGYVSSSQQQQTQGNQPYSGPLADYQPQQMRQQRQPLITQSPVRSNKSSQYGSSPGSYFGTPTKPGQSSGFTPLAERKRRANSSGRGSAPSKISPLISANNSLSTGVTSKIAASSRPQTAGGLQQKTTRPKQLGTGGGGGGERKIRFNGAGPFGIAEDAPAAKKLKKLIGLDDMNKELWVEAKTGAATSNAVYYYNANTLKVSPNPPSPTKGVVVNQNELIQALDQQQPPPIMVRPVATKAGAAGKGAAAADTPFVKEDELRKYFKQFGTVMMAVVRALPMPINGSKFEIWFRMRTVEEHFKIFDQPIHQINGQRVRLIPAQNRLFVSRLPIVKSYSFKDLFVHFRNKVKAEFGDEYGLFDGYRPSIGGEPLWQFTFLCFHGKGSSDGKSGGAKVVDFFAKQADLQFFELSVSCAPCALFKRPQNLMKDSSAKQQQIAAGDKIPAKKAKMDEKKGAQNDTNKNAAKATAQEKVVEVVDLLDDDEDGDEQEGEEEIAPQLTKLAETLFAVRVDELNTAGQQSKARYLSQIGPEVRQMMELFGKEEKSGDKNEVVPSPMDLAILDRINEEFMLLTEPILRAYLTVQRHVVELCQQIRQQRPSFPPKKNKLAASKQQQSTTTNNSSTATAQKPAQEKTVTVQPQQQNKEPAPPTKPIPPPAATTDNSVTSKTGDDPNKTTESNTTTTVPVSTGQTQTQELVVNTNNTNEKGGENTNMADDNDNPWLSPRQQPKANGSKNAENVEKTGANENSTGKDDGGEGFKSLIASANSSDKNAAVAEENGKGVPEETAPPTTATISAESEENANKKVSGDSGSGGEGDGSTVQTESQQA